MFVLPGLPGVLGCYSCHVIPLFAAQNATQYLLMLQLEMPYYAADTLLLQETTCLILRTAGTKVFLKILLANKNTTTSFSRRQILNHVLIKAVVFTERICNHAQYMLSKTLLSYTCECAKINSPPVFKKMYCFHVCRRVQPCLYAGQSEC